MANRFWLSAILCGVSLSTQACTKTEDEESLKQEIRRSEEHYKQEAGADSKADEEAEEALSKETKQRPLHKNTVTLPALEKAVAENLTASWEIKSVKTVNGALTIRTNIRRITDIIYYAMLPGVCYDIDQHGAAPSLNEIQILNSFGRQGWVFESPAQCPQIVQTPLNKVRLAIAVHTHLFSN